MPSADKEEFLREVLSHIRFSLDREDIRYELESHILDKKDDYIAEGYDPKEAEQMAVADMGDPVEIGVELNKQHNPIIGWLWMITNAMVVLFVVWHIFVLGSQLLRLLFQENLLNDIPKENIVYQIDVDEKVKIDDTVIHFTHVVYEKNGDLNIFFKHYDTRLWGTGWSLAGIGTIEDNLGNEYFEGGSYASGGIISNCRRIVRNFSEEADMLIISYDYYNRKYRVEIPLKAGDTHDQDK